MTSAAVSSSLTTNPNELDSETLLDKNEMKKRRIVRDSQLRLKISSHQWPIVYSSHYNITCMGLERCHPFDSTKWGKVFKICQDAGWLTKQNTIEPNEAKSADLLISHTFFYLKSLFWPCQVARAVEVPIVAILLPCIIERCLLKPFRYQVGGTVAAAYFALERGWAINIGGGFHHASSNSGAGFCIYNDITISLQFLFNDTSLKKSVRKAMIIDLDAHQGNGHERDFKGDERVYIFDMFNYKAISKAVRLRKYTEDAEYLRELKSNLKDALNEFFPDIIIYNAGTDCYEEDPLGCLSISAKGIKTRDEFVFRQAKKHQIPIVMVTSGGYTRESAGIIADSLLNLKKKNIIKLESILDDNTSEDEI
uniref:Histone deacetylase domain-containing protein n=1 Tax=Panagrolaimus sp. ES5 TaxID=591445 RepID=A0AC34GYE2_9BILA